MYRCPECRTRRKLFTDMLRHVQTSGHRLCNCGAYPWGTSKHRPGSPACVHNPMSAAVVTKRYGVEGDDLLEIAIDCALFKPGREWRGLNPPF